MDDEALLTAIGLLLSQLRVARRAIEDIERSTARYNNFAFAAALSAGANFGQPPMFSGALKVWVVNINDLAPSAGGGFIEQLLGGIGRLLGGFGGGALGGILGGLKLPDMISKVQQIAASVEHILARLGIQPEDDKKKDGKKEEPGLVQTLKDWKGIFDTFTALFLAASGKPEKAEDTSTSMTDGAKRWLQIVDSTSTLMNSIERVVLGLTVLIPVAIGALAELIVQLDSIKLAIVDLLQFLLRELFLLRGVLLATVFDTLSAVAKLASSVLGILSVALNSIAVTVFDIFKNVFAAAIQTIKFLSDGLQTTVDTVVRWMVDVVGQALAAIAASPLFQEVVHIVNVLPDILPPLVIALQGTSAAGSIDTKALEDAKKLNASAMAAMPSAAAGLSSATLKAPPTISDSLGTSTAFAQLQSNVSDAIGAVKTDLKDVFSSATGALNIMNAQLADIAKDKGFNDSLKQYTTDLRANSDKLAAAITLQQLAADKAAGKGDAKTGFEEIAKAYEGWLTTGGLNKLLTDFTAYFKKPENLAPLKESVTGPTVMDRPRATVDIQDVIIQLAEPPPVVENAPGKPAGPQAPEETLKLVVELIHELNERGVRWNAGSLLMQV